MTPALRPTAVAPVDLADLARAAGAHLVGAPPEPGTAVSGVVADNRRVTGGELFVARPGARHHAARFTSDAVARSAAAVLTDAAGADLARADGEPGVPVLVVDDVAAVVGPLAALAWGNPADRLRTYALTGTNGKTTTAFMVDHVLTALGRTTGLIGTVEIRIAGTSVPAALTTPQADELHAVLAAMVEAGVTDLVMEVSSHALMLGRVDGVTFDVAGFTHLTPDHLDLHGSVEEYFAAKARLFAPERSRAGVVTVDDEWGRRLAASAEEARPGDVWSLGHDADAQLGVRSGAPGELTLVGEDGRVATSTDMPGAFNVANAALAVGMVWRAGHDPAEIERALAGAGGVSPAVPGRMEVLAEAPRVVVDFAHNTEALETVLTELRPTTRGRLWCVTGSAGDRDAVKRPLMGAVAARLADEVVVTDDDPHSEDPAAIRAEILAGAHAVEGASVTEVGDRRTAIAHAILAAAPEDTVLLAGRGHETVQEVGDVAHHLDDREEARAALARRASGEDEA
ncbi:UDP-N-acetylmuramoyl-L-alanyl-D-glutamate--2,6-diaminopimelate ligase [Georgenia sp. Z1344]|uniref:UDP-N-acetylmuramoyl-L-alanyl-D-glutamate--2, 6-diaminopimelate ligase n=1 Tax=Georgenia sp. Z1344 TaxID=3416706 RepID=UPI003CF6809D